MASITMSSEEYGDMLLARQTAEKRCGELECELVQAKMADPADRVQALTTLCRSALTVVRFAVGNLPPESIRGWPSGALRSVSTLIPYLADYTVDDRDLLGELVAFATECEQYARRRQVLPSSSMPLPAPAIAADTD